MIKKPRNTEGHSSKKSKGCFTVIVIFLLLIIGASLLFFSWWVNETSPVNPSEKQAQIFVVPQGWGVEQIAQRLKQEGLIKNPLVFKLMTVKEKIAKDLQAGDFRLSPSMNTFEIAQALTHGSLDVWVTIPEGLRREEIAELIFKAFAKQDANFDKKDFIQKTANFEGFLFSDTYLIPKNASVEEIIKIFKDNFNQKINLLSKNMTLTLNQVVILASLLEREAKHQKDRPIVAGILLKRLKNGWPLQIDASIQYAMASSQCLAASSQCDWWPKVSARDLKIKSAYNTYENIDLPPTPICNPSLNSLESVVNPQETEYWFYLSDPAGNIHYAATNEEHEANIEKYIQGTAMFP